jgi:hypothetical protein
VLTVVACAGWPVFCEAASRVEAGSRVEARAGVSPAALTQNRPAAAIRLNTVDRGSLPGCWRRQKDALVQGFSGFGELSTGQFPFRAVARPGTALRRLISRDKHGPHATEAEGQPSGSPQAVSLDGHPGTLCLR